MAAVSFTVVVIMSLIVLTIVTGMINYMYRQFDAIIQDRHMLYTGVMRDMGFQMHRMSNQISKLTDHIPQMATNQVPFMYGAGNLDRYLPPSYEDDIKRIHVSDEEVDEEHGHVDSDNSSGNGTDSDTTDSDTDSDTGAGSDTDTDTDTVVSIDVDFANINGIDGVDGGEMLLASASHDLELVSDSVSKSNLLDVGSWCTARIDPMIFMDPMLCVAYATAARSHINLCDDAGTSSMSGDLNYEILDAETDFALPVSALPVSALPVSALPVSALPVSTTVPIHKRPVEELRKLAAAIGLDATKMKKSEVIQWLENADSIKIPYDKQTLESLRTLAVSIGIDASGKKTDLVHKIGEYYSSVNCAPETPSHESIANADVRVHLEPSEAADVRVHLEPSESETKFDPESVPVSIPIFRVDGGDMDGGVGADTITECDGSSNSGNSSIDSDSDSDGSSIAVIQVELIKSNIDIDETGLNQDISF